MVMEDCNTLVSDCIVISCCCEFLILRLTVFIFVQLPRVIVCKTREYARKKLGRRKMNAKSEKKENHRHRAEFTGFDKGRSVSMEILEGIEMNKMHKWGSCSDEVEKGLGELSMKGEFAFGSFWGGNNQENERMFSKCSRTKTNDEGLEYGNHVVHFHFIEVVGPPLGSS